MATDTAAILAVFRVLAPEFSATSDATVNALTGVLADTLTASVFGGQISSAVARLAAHELTLQARDAASSAGARGVGAVASVGSGDLSISFAGPSSPSFSSEDDELRQTRHGLAFLRIRDSRDGTGLMFVA